MTREDIFKTAFIELFEHFYNDYTPEEYDDIVSEVGYETLAQSVLAGMETVYSYRASTKLEHTFQYCSIPLLPIRACLLFSDNKGFYSGEVFEDYCIELWMTEEFKFILINSFSVTFPCLSTDYATVYRSINKENLAYKDLPCSLEDLVDTLIEMYNRHTPVPIYEI